MTDAEFDALPPAEKRKAFDERIASGYYVKRLLETARVATPVVTLPVSERLAEAIKENPGSVRVSARAADGLHRVEGARANPRVGVRVDLVREVDEEGRPVWDRGGAVHEYNPLDALRRG